MAKRNDRDPAFGDKLRWLLPVGAVSLAAITLLVVLGIRGTLFGQKNEPSGTGNKTPATLPQLEDASYENWLAAAMVVGLSMEYPDFEISGIYTSTETELKDRKNSDGVFIFFKTGTETLVLHSGYLAGERAAAGTRDISSQVLGFASFDLVESATVNTEGMRQILLEDLSKLIAQSMLVSIYTH